MARIYVQLYSAYDGEPYWVSVADIPDDQLITTFEMGIMTGEGVREPLMRMPLSQHGDVKTLHTICRRFPDDEIDKVES